MSTAFLPFYGEFGWLILHHIRHVHQHEAEHKIVCCEPGQECLFPTASEFFFDWRHPVPDNYRCGSGAYRYAANSTAADIETIDKLKLIWPDCEPYRTTSYGCPWHMSDSIKFRPTPRVGLPAVDIAICPRKRGFVESKNWQHWEPFTAAMTARGLTVGIAGAKSTSVDLAGSAKAWSHPDGETAGTCDLLGHCKLFVGSDTGVSHLAALIDTPMVVMRKNERGNPDYTGMMQRASKAPFHRLPDNYWTQPEKVIDDCLRFYGDLTAAT